jgi:redox-regulated HSP33 family molecular chaperone
MNDYLVKALGYNGQVRAYAVSATKTVGKRSGVIIPGLPLLLL